MAKKYDFDGSVALQAIELVSTFDQAEDDLRVQYRTKDWEQGKGWFDVGGHYVSLMDCSDTFFWGSADAEEVTAENIDILRDVIAELKPRFEEAWARRRGPEGEALDAERSAAYDAFAARTGIDLNSNEAASEWRKTDEYKALAAKEIWPHKFAPVGDLFAARVRKMRPQGAAYRVRYDPSIWDLFNECGPERETGIGNPKKIGE